MKSLIIFERSDVETVIKMFEILDTMASNVLDNGSVNDPFTGITYYLGGISLDGETMEKFYNFMDDLHNTLMTGEHFGYEIEKKGEE